MTGTKRPYYAVPDPNDPNRMTYWQRGPAGGLTPHPPRTRYSPRLLRSDVPDWLTGRERQTWVEDWARQHVWPWYAAIHAAIDADPQACTARFAAFTTRCCECGRTLRDPVSKTYGIGPDCRDGIPNEVLAAMARMVGQAHAEAAHPTTTDDNEGDPR